MNAPGTRIDQRVNELGSVCQTALLIAALFLNGGCQTQPGARSAGTPVPASADNAFPPPRTKAAQLAMTPPQALAELRAGNLRFVSGKPQSYHPLARVKATASGQYPIAAILSCIDSRQPVELVFDQSIGDVFSARVAGNVLDEDVLGSLEFACKIAGAKLIAVIGHSNCGAIKGAADGVVLGNLTELLAKIKPAIDRVPSDGQPRNSKNHDFVEHAAEANVRLVLEQIRARSPILREMIDRGQILLVGGMYDLSTGQVHFYGDGDK